MSTTKKFISVNKQQTEERIVSKLEIKFSTLKILHLV